MDNKGYVLAGLAFLLIIPSILMLIVLIDVLNMDRTSNIVLESDTAFQLSRDVERNIPILAEETIKNTDEEVVKTGKPLSDSRKTIKNRLQTKMDVFNNNYKKNTAINVICNIKSVDSDSNPFNIEINSSISVSKGNISYNRNITQKLAILYSDVRTFTGKEENFLLKDPLPFIKCKGYGEMKIKDGRISYGSSLSKYLKSKQTLNAEVYENATSTLYIKMCPYEPYKSHGQSNRYFNLKNCIDNGYYHISSDGACFLCRLEGKSTCPHLGLETFILPGETSINTLSKAPCSVDHVIFDDQGETYLGDALDYYANDNNFKIFLDIGHCSKYGISK